MIYKYPKLNCFPKLTAILITFVKSIYFLALQLHLFTVVGTTSTL